MFYGVSGTFSCTTFLAGHYDSARKILLESLAYPWPRITPPCPPPCQGWWSSHQGVTGGGVLLLSYSCSPEVRTREAVVVGAESETSLVHCRYWRRQWGEGFLLPYWNMGHIIDYWTLFYAWPYYIQHCCFVWFIKSSLILRVQSQSQIYRNSYYKFFDIEKNVFKK